MEEIITKNEKGEKHGYQEWYTYCALKKLWYKGSFKNGFPIGYSIWNPKLGGIGDEGTDVIFNIR